MLEFFLVDVIGVLLLMLIFNVIVFGLVILNKCFGLGNVSGIYDFNFVFLIERF